MEITYFSVMLQEEVYIITEPLGGEMKKLHILETIRLVIESMKLP